MGGVTGGMGGLFGGGGGGGGVIGGMGLDLAPYKMPIVGGFFQNPDELHAKNQQHEMAMAYGGMRPENQRSQENALRQSSMAYQPYQNLMAMGYGDSAATPTEGLMDNPMSDRAMGLGSPDGMDGVGPDVPASLEGVAGGPLGAKGAGGGGASLGPAFDRDGIAGGTPGAGMGGFGDIIGGLFGGAMASGGGGGGGGMGELAGMGGGGMGAMGSAGGGAGIGQLAGMLGGAGTAHGLGGMAGLF